jgi:hypothetical protein
MRSIPGAGYPFFPDDAAFPSSAVKEGKVASVVRLFRWQFNVGLGSSRRVFLGKPFVGFVLIT